MKPEASRLTRGYTIAFVSAAVLSTTAIFIRHLTETYDLPALVLAFWRDSFVALTLLPVLAWRWPRLLRVSRRDLGYLAAYGFVLSLFNALWTLSVALNGAAVSTVLVYCSGGFTALLGWWLLGERLDRGKLLAVALTLGGAALVSGALDPAAWRGNLAGIVTGLLSGLGYSLYSLMGRSASQRGLSPWTTLLYTFAFAAGFLLLYNLVPGDVLPGTARAPGDLLWLGDALAGWALLFALAAGPTVLGFGLYNTSLAYLPASVANLIVTLEPAFTAAIAYVVLSERLDALQIAGSVLILAAVIWLRIHEDRLAARARRAAGAAAEALPAK
jgi:drug/metabolite transporter (DMT)-like permease